MSDPDSHLTLNDLYESDFLGSPFPRVIFEETDGEVVVVDLVRGIYYYLTGTAAFLWMALHAGQSVGETATRLSEVAEDGDEVSADLERFALSLMREGLLESRDAIADSEFSVPDLQVFVTGAYAPPVIETYSDLQDILLLDPVHDVDDSGWPTPRSN